MLEHNSIPEQIQPQLLKLSLIELDEGIQPRQKLSQEVITEYAEAMRQGATFPPVIVFFDGNKYWLADGFHRIAAKKANGDLEIITEKKLGSRRDAILYAVGANATYGLQRSNDDKRKVIKKMLSDHQWCQWSNREIARRCKVSYEMVRNIRNELPDNRCQIQKLTKISRKGDRRLVLRKGKTYSMNISNLKHPK
ncbi:ParB N-terminal domain-containing protein [Acaryochloris marina]|uniref:ParB-like N-terminal domain-containing protein n=1 Tax=Acaryochloris marina (strain MBIC 11017) TaxID=329726 RepID=A8ZPS2_ACAM1|nr:ParB N-terminal domain-containing protein [Acaryochloris marina]ABW33055.1 conserved hypothetical protein [Acaryochloris marina MBIC11017]